MTVREIELKDNAALAQLLRATLTEMGVPKTGTAFEDPEIDAMFEAYQRNRHSYFILEEAGKVIGGAGIAPLANGPDGVCELQKMYFSPTARGKGWGAKMIMHCLEYATSQGFTKCYIETLPNMQAAQNLYVKKGFTYLEAPLGSTGHNSCSVWMIKEL